MITATFEVKRHEDFGELGLAMVGRQWAEPLDGRVAAHDLLEHFPKDAGNIEGELMALGASLLVRDGQSYLAQRRIYNLDLAEHFASDHIMQVSSYGGDNYTLGAIASRPLDDENLDDFIVRSVSKARDMFPVEFDDMFELENSYLAQPERVVGWMRRGYRRAVKRYRDIQSWKLCQTFINAEDAMQSFLKNAEEGYRCKVSINPRSEQTRVIELWNEDY